MYYHTNGVVIKVLMLAFETKIIFPNFFFFWYFD